MTTATDVLIIGAGPTGLTMANLLARNGVRVRILDKKAGPTQETRAIAVHAKTLELLDKLDLADEAIAEGEEFRAIQLFSQGKRAGKISFRAIDRKKLTPYPFGLIYGQDQTEHLLLKELAKAGSQVEWNTEVLSLEQTPGGACVCIRAADGSEETIEAQWIVGADGSRSYVRQTLSLGFTGRTYTQTLFIADLDIEWNSAPQQGSMDLTRQGFFLFLPMRGKGQFRLFGTLPPEMANRGTMTLDDVRKVIDVQGNLHINMLRANWISLYHTHQRMAERFRVGRVFLAGDAAHIHSPAGGQGMNTGIGDAYNLAWKLALVVKGQAHETLLDSYEAERMPFARSILNGSDWGFQLMTATGPILRWLKLFIIPPLLTLLSYLPIFRQSAFWLLSQLWTSYRNSPVVTNAGRPTKKGPRAGDRAPYGFFEAGPDASKSIFTLLQNQDHHLFLFAGKELHTDILELAEKLQAQLNTYSAPIHLHVVSAENHSLHTLYRADTPTLFLVRPDGHIAYRGGAEYVDNLKSYLNKVFKKSIIPVHASGASQEPLHH